MASIIIGRFYRLKKKNSTLKKILSLLLTVSCFTAQASKTEFHFFVEFNDKALNYVNIEKPELFLSQRSIDRRKRMGIKIDSMDLPVTKAYIDNIRKPSIQIRYASKWLNGVFVTTEVPDSAYILKIKFFVKDVKYLGKSTIATSKSGSKSVLVSNTTTEDTSEYGKGFKQIEMLYGNKLHQAGYRGEGMLVAVLDAGFKKLDQLSLFEPLFNEKRIVYTYDFVDRESNVYNDDDHGLHVMGCLAANSPKDFVGTAPNANYLLFRTESSKFENWLEEVHWVRAAEVADSMGVDVINSSLGYNTFDEKRLDHTHDDLNGKTTYISNGAAAAATRGILVVNSAGNDGNKSWGRLDFPADVEDILVVGAVDDNLEVTSFSSPGPTIDLRVKPDVVALGENTVVATTYGSGNGNGTSYSCPIVAGLATCLMQSNPNATVSQIKKWIIASSHLSLNPDYMVGHGVPNFNLALILAGNHPSFEYNKPQVVDFEKTQFKSIENVTVYCPNKKLAYATVKMKKRFLFISYQKKKTLLETNIQPNGFGKMSIELFNIPVNKQATIEFYFYDESGDKVVFNSVSGVRN